MRQPQNRHTQTHTVKFCPSSASGLGQLCCGSHPWASSPVSQTAEAPKGQQTAGRQVLPPSTSQTRTGVCVCLCVDAHLSTDKWVFLHLSVCVYTAQTGTNKHVTAHLWWLPLRDTHTGSQSVSGYKSPNTLLLHSEARYNVQCWYCVCACVCVWGWSAGRGGGPWY